MGTTTIARNKETTEGKPPEIELVAPGWGQRIADALWRGAPLLWAGWASAMIYAHGVAIAECKQWRAVRPEFVTRSQQELDLLKKEKELREMFNNKVDQRFSEMGARMDKALETQQEIVKTLGALDKRLAEHMAAK